MQFSDFDLDIHVELMKVNTTGAGKLCYFIQINNLLTDSQSKQSVKRLHKISFLHLVAFGGDTYDLGCFSFQEKAQMTIEQIYTSPMQHSVFAGFFMYCGKKPMLNLSSFLIIKIQPYKQILHFNMFISVIFQLKILNRLQLLIQKQPGTQLDGTLIMKSFQLFGNNFQIQMLNNKSFFPKQIELTVKVVKLYDPTYRSCPKVYTECMFQGDPIYVCDETVKLTNIWKEFKSLREDDQKMKFKLNIVLLYDEQTEEDQEYSEDTILIVQA